MISTCKSRWGDIARDLLEPRFLGSDRHFSEYATRLPGLSKPECPNGPSVTSVRPQAEQAPNEIRQTNFRGSRAIHLTGNACVGTYLQRVLGRQTRARLLHGIIKNSLPATRSGCWQPRQWPTTSRRVTGLHPIFLFPIPRGYSGSHCSNEAGPKLCHRG